MSTTAASTVSSPTRAWVCLKSVDETQEQDFDRVVEVSFKGVFLTIQKSLLALRKEGGNPIINASWTSHRGMETVAVYDRNEGRLAQS
ncbi:hypothetical protein [Streptomyces sp. 900105755]